MSHASEPQDLITSALTAARSHRPAEQIATALRVLSLRLGEAPFLGLSASASRRLSFACSGFAELIPAAEAPPGNGMSLRSRACFLLSALFALRLDDGASPLSDLDEAWMVAEVEADFGEALALFEAHAGRFRSPVPPRPLLDRPTTGRRSPPS